MLQQLIFSRLPRYLALAILISGVFLIAPKEAMAQEKAVKLEGILLSVWGDPHPDATTSTVRHHLVLDDETRIPVVFDDGDDAAAFTAFGKRVVIDGTQEVTPAGVSTIRASSLTLVGPEIKAVDEDLSPQAVTRRKVLHILLRYKGDRQRPHSLAFYRALTNPKRGNNNLGIPATINGYFLNLSSGRMKWSGDIAGNRWFTLPGRKTDYADCGWGGACADLWRLADDALDLVQAAGVDISTYDNLSFVINNDLDCCAWGGGFYKNGKRYGVTWSPPWAQETGTFVHEFGHSIGLPHSGWKYYAYDSPWDNMSRRMSARSLACGSYRSANNDNARRTLYCTKPGSGYIAAHKAILGWIPPARQVVIDSAMSLRVHLEANAYPLGKSSKAKMIKICIPGKPCTGTRAKYFTVEARHKVRTEKGMPGEGVLIHRVDRARRRIGVGDACYFNSQSGWAVPVDATRGDWRAEPYCDSGGRSYPDYALFNAQFKPGMSYTNNRWGIKVRVLSKTADGYWVRVTRTQ